MSTVLNEIKPCRFNSILFKAAVVCVCLIGTVSNADAALTWKWDRKDSAGKPLDVDGKLISSSVRDNITRTMDWALWNYNRFSNYTWEIKVKYDPDTSRTATASGSYLNSVTFGKNRTTSGQTALHEVAHVLGIGTYSQWNKNRNGNKWTGGRANGLYQSWYKTDLNAGAIHFWNHNYNSPRDSVSDVNVERHVRMVGRIREDMGLSNKSNRK